jgi:hypothetical protein
VLPTIPHGVWFIRVTALWVEFGVPGGGALPAPGGTAVPVAGAAPVAVPPEPAPLPAANVAALVQTNSTAANVARNPRRIGRLPALQNPTLQDNAAAHRLFDQISRQ